MTYLDRRYRTAAMPQPTEQDAGIVVQPTVVAPDTDGDSTTKNVITQEQLDDELGRNGSYIEEFQPHARPVGEHFKAQKAMDLAGGEGTGASAGPQPGLHETGRGNHPAGKPTGTMAGTGTSPYLADWSQGFSTVMFGRPAREGHDEVKAQDLPISQAIADYNRWAKDNNGEKLDPFVIYPLLSQYNDLTKSIADNKKEEKRKQMKNMFEQLGYLLLNAGNFAGAAMGGPSPSSPPDSVELTSRQKRLQQYAEAQRQATARDYLSILRQQQADERAGEDQKIRARREERYDKEQERKQALTEAQVGKYRAAEAKDDAMTAYYKTKEQAIIDGKPLDVALKEAKIAYEKAKTNKVNSGGGSKSIGGGKRSSGIPEGYEEVTVKTGDRKNSRTVKYRQRRSGLGNKPPSRSKSNSIPSRRK